MAAAQWHASLADLESGLDSKPTEVAQRAMRGGFVKKVFGLLCAQLALTTLIGAVCVGSTTARTFLLNNPILPGLAALGGLVLVAVLTTSEKARTTHPNNLILLTAFTICEGLLVGLASAHYPADLVITALVLTVAVSGGLAVYAARTKSDFTVHHGWLTAMLFAFVSVVFMGAVFHVPMFRLGVSMAGAALFAAFLVFDIQMIMGNGQFKMGPDEYVLATIQIYLDLVNMFLHILRALADRRE